MLLVPKAAANNCGIRLYCCYFIRYSKNWCVIFATWVELGYAKGQQRMGRRTPENNNGRLEKDNMIPANNLI